MRQILTTSRRCRPGRQPFQGSVLVSRCDFPVHYPDLSRCWAPFRELLAMCASPCEMLIPIFCLLKKNWVVCILFIGSLYIFQHKAFVKDCAVNFPPAFRCPIHFVSGIF